jgi:hypothetical protein
MSYTGFYSIKNADIENNSSIFPKYPTFFGNIFFVCFENKLVSSIVQCVTFGIYIYRYRSHFYSDSLKLQIRFLAKKAFFEDFKLFWFW